MIGNHSGKSSLNAIPVINSSLELIRFIVPPIPKYRIITQCNPYVSAALHFTNTLLFQRAFLTDFLGELENDSISWILGIFLGL